MSMADNANKKNDDVPRKKTKEEIEAEQQAAKDQLQAILDSSRWVSIRWFFTRHLHINIMHTPLIFNPIDGITCCYVVQSTWDMELPPVLAISSVEQLVPRV